MHLLDVVTCCNVGEAELQRVVLSSIDSKSTHLQLLHYSSGLTDSVASRRYVCPALAEELVTPSTSLSARCT